MKKFQFRLQKLLWYHQQRQKRAEVQLQQAAWRRDSAAEAINIIRLQIDHACQLQEAVGGIIDLGARHNATHHLNGLLVTLTSTEEKLKQADQQLREAQRVHAEITRDVEALIHLRSEQKREHLDQIAHHQQILLDEVVMRQWSMRDADPASSS